MAEENQPPEGEEQGALGVPDADAGQQTETEQKEPDGGEAPPANDAPPSIEDMAGEMGWRPQNEWRGDPDKWKPAHEFVRSTIDVNHKLTNRLKGVEDQLGRMARTSAQVTEQAVARERQRLLDERDRAFDEGDRDAFHKAEKALTQLQVPESGSAVPDEAQSFVEKHSNWFGKDQEATAFAQNRCEELAKMGLSPARQLATVEREMKGYFPELFPSDEPKQRPKAAPLNQPGARGGMVAKKGFSAMPADAQAAALDYEKRGVCTKDEYAATYFEQEGV